MKRTERQNNSLHLWLDQVAKELNGSGQSLGDGLLVRLPISYTKENLKELVVKPMLHAMWPEKTSTTELSTIEMQRLYEELDEIISSRSGVHVEFPSEESLMEAQR